jgi:hypothetical protein
MNLVLVLIVGFLSPAMDEPRDVMLITKVFSEQDGPIISQNFGDMSPNQFLFPIERFIERKPVVEKSVLLPHDFFEAAQGVLLEHKEEERVNSLEPP